VCEGCQGVCGACDMNQIAHMAPTCQERRLRLPAWVEDGEARTRDLAQTSQPAAATVALAGRGAPRSEPGQKSLSLSLSVRDSCHDFVTTCAPRLAVVPIPLR
jgi:hypothetical protein